MGRGRDFRMPATIWEGGQGGGKYAILLLTPLLLLSLLAMVYSRDRYVSFILRDATPGRRTSSTISGEKGEKGGRGKKKAIILRGPRIAPAISNVCRGGGERKAFSNTCSQERKEKQSSTSILHRDSRLRVSGTTEKKEKEEKCDS